MTTSEAHSPLSKVDLLPPYVCRHKPCVTEDYMFGFVGGSSRYCIESFFPTRRQPNLLRVTQVQFGRMEKPTAEKQGSGVSAGLSEIYLSEAA
jgi:hypothetical protein